MLRCLVTRQERSTLGRMEFFVELTITEHDFDR